MAKLGAAALLTLPGDPRLRRVLLAYGLSRFTEFAGWLAILLVAYAQGGALLVGIASFAMQLPAIVLVPLLAGFVDRLPRGAGPDPDARERRRQRGAHRGPAVPGRALCGSSSSAGPPPPSRCSPSVRRTSRPCPCWPRVPGTSCRPTGGPRSWTARPSSSGSSSRACSPMSSGRGSSWPCAPLLGVVATLLTSGLHTPVVGTGHADAPGELRAALEGVATLRRSAGALALLLLMACTSVIQGSNETLTVTFNDEVLGLPESTAGLLAGAYGVGIALGGITLAGLAQRAFAGPGRAVRRPAARAGPVLGGPSRCPRPGRDHADARGRRDGDDHGVGPNPAPAHHGRRGARPGACRPGGRAPHGVDHRCARRSAGDRPVRTQRGLRPGRVAHPGDRTAGGPLDPPARRSPPSTTRARSRCWGACPSSPPCPPTSSSASPRAREWVAVVGRHPRW